jgi:uncharacterized protein (TIRG00374 family)
MMDFLHRLFAVVTSLPGRLIITAGLLAVVAMSIDWTALDDSLAGAAWGWFALGTGGIVLALLIGALRWHVLLHHAQLPTAPRQTLRAYGIGIFSNNFLPTGFGGDVVRAWLVARSGNPLARSFTSVAVDRAVALVSLFAIGWLGLALSPVTVPGKLLAPFAGATAGTVLITILALVVLRRRGLSRFLPSMVRPWASEVARTLRKYGRDHRLQMEALILSVAFQALMITALWTMTKALQLDVSPVALAVVMPLVLIATLMPISVAGFGVREGVYIVLLGELGVSASEATLLSLFSVAALAIASLPGGLAILMGGELARTRLGSMPAEAPVTAEHAPSR